MGCRCCKMIHSYLFDPVQVPSPGFVNEVNNCKLDEDDTLRLKGTQNSEAEVPRNALHGGSLTKTQNRDSTAGLPHQGQLPREDLEKHGIVNGISPKASLHLVRSPNPHQVDRSSWASSPWAGTTDSTHQAQPFLEEDCRKQSCVVPAAGETQIVAHGDGRGPAEVLEVADDVLHIPVPDYPHLWSPTVDSADPAEKDSLFKNHPGVEPLPGIHPGTNEQGLSLPFSLKRSWDSLNEAVTTEVLNVYFKEEGPPHPTPVTDSKNEQEVPHTYNGDRDGVVTDEDAEVAEALAALEAATAGEDADEAVEKSSGPWNKTALVQAPPAPVIVTETPEPAMPSGVYRPPGARLTTTRKTPQGPPEIYSDTQFPSLQSTAKHGESRKDKEMEKSFEVVRHKNRGREEVSKNQALKLQLDNQYAVLENTQKYSHTQYS